MIADLKPYPEYEESGLPWLGDIPQHWVRERAKWLFTKMDRPVREGDEVVTCFRDGMVTLRKNRRLRGFTEATVYSGYQGIRKGDLVIHGMDAFAGAIGVSDSDGKGTPVYNVCQPRSGVNASYYAHLVRQMSQSQWILALAKGIRERSTDFRFEMFGNQRVPLPPPDEQAAIVRFLDWANGRLERAIRAKRKVIALLNEQEQAIIHRAVTRGLNPSVLLKPSGVPWLGDIPKHWEVISLRMRYSVELGKMLDAKRITGRHSIPYLRNRDVQWDRVLTDDLPVMDIPPSEIARYTVKRGDLLVCEGGQVGRSAFWDERLPVCGFQKALHRVRSLDSSRDYSRFFFYQMQLAAGRGVFSADGNENTFAHLTCEKLRRHRFAFPPFTEQKAVADHLDGELRQFQIATSRLEREIELLREYRTRLVADVVTGKLDVRAAAAKLPEESGDLKPLDDADALTEVDEETGDADLDAVIQEAEA